jgi:hypothetical protein
LIYFDIEYISSFESGSLEAIMLYPPLVFTAILVGGILVTFGEYNGGSVIVGVGLGLFIFRGLQGFRIIRSQPRRWIIGGLSTIFGLVIVVVIEPQLDIQPARSVREALFQAITIGLWVVSLSCFLDLNAKAAKELES